MASKDLTLNIFANNRNAKEAFAQLAASVAALNLAMKSATGESDRHGRSLDELKRKAEDAKGKGIGPLATAILAIGPALIPIAAVATAALGPLAGLAGTAYLVFKGISQEMKAGTIVGQSYTAGMDVLKTHWQGLQTIAATNFLPGFNAGLAAMEPLWPSLNRDVAMFSSQLGQIAANVAPGLVGMLKQMEPLFQTLGQMLIDGSARFKDWGTSSSSFSTFLSYAKNQLPLVLSTLGQLLEALGHLAVAFAPFGSTSLMAIRLLSQAINAIPISVLSALVPVIASVVLGLKAMRVADSAAASMAVLSAKMKLAGGGMAESAGHMSTAGKVMGALGKIAVVGSIALGIWSVVQGENAAKAAAATEATNSYATALEASKGAIDANVRATAAKNLVDSGAAAAARELGLSLPQMTDAVLGDADAQKSLGGQLESTLGRLKAQDAEAGVHHDIFSRQKILIAAVADALGLQGTAFKNGTQQQRDYADAQKLSVDETEHYTAAQYAAAAAVGLTVPEYIEGAAAVDKQKESMAAARKEMLKAADAAKLLKSAYDYLNGVVLDSNDAEMAFNASLNTLDSTMKDHTRDWSKSTVAGIANNQAVDAAIKLAEQHGTQIGKETQALAGAGAAQKTVTGAVADGTLATLKDLVALREKVVAVGGNTTAIDAMITKIKATPINKNTTFTNTAPSAKQQVLHYHGTINGVPRDIYTTINSNATNAINAMFAVQAAIRGIPLNVYTTVWTSYRAGERTPAAGGLVRAAGGPIHAAGGAYVSGRGSGIADNIRALLSPGEFVSTAAATRRNMGALLAMNAGVAPSRYNGSGSSTAPTVVNLTMPVLYGNADAAARDILGALQRLKGQGVKINLGAAR